MLEPALAVGRAEHPLGDVQDVRAVVHDVLRHRIGMKYEAEAENVTSVDLINKIVNEVEVP